MRQNLDELISWANSQLQGDEVLTASPSAEGSVDGDHRTALSVGVCA